MLLQCTNKGCCKSGEHKLNVETDEVICEFCGKPIPQITKITKKVLKDIKQVVNTSVKKAWMMECKNCQANRQVFFDKSTNKVLCKVCGSEIQVHAAMRQALMEQANLKKEDE